MKATVKKYVLRTCKGANGSFQVLDIFADVVNDKNEVRTYRGQMGAEYAKKYFEHCGVKTKETIAAGVRNFVSKRTIYNERRRTTTSNKNQIFQLA